MEPSQQTFNVNKVPHFSSFRRSSTDIKTKNITDYLINEIGLTQRSALILMDVHKSETKAQALQLLTLDDQMYYNHVFVPTLKQTKSDPQCEVCGDSKQRHTIFDMAEPQQQNPVYSSFIFEDQFSQERPNHRRSLLNENQERKPQSFPYKIQNDSIQESQGLQKGILCQICYMRYQLQNIAVFSSQQHNLCNQCMTSYVNQKITSMEIESISCPHCSIKLTSQIIKQFASPQIFKLYEKFVKNLEVQKNPNLMWCPNPKCAVVISVQKKKKIFSCPKCQFKICSKCKHEAHGMKSCSSNFENQIKKWQNSSSIQRCRKCSSIVEKVSGCNHMSCTICGHEWCWLCGADYSDRHYSPLNPFGCAGMQNRDDVGSCRIWIWRIVLFILLMLGLPAAIPLFLLLSGPFVAIEFFYNKVKYGRNFLLKVLSLIVGFIVGLIFNPFIWIGLVVEFSPRFLRGIREHFRSRRRRRQNAENRLNERLINDAIVNSDNLVIAIDETR